MDVQFAEPAAKILLLVEVDFLITKEDDEMLGQGVVDFLELLISQRLG